MAEVLFPGRSQPTLVSTRGNTLLPHPFAPGDRVRTGKGWAATITGEEPGGRGLRRYVLRYEDGTEDELPESEVHAPPPDTDVLTTLRDGRVADARAFLLRRQALTLDDERRNDALGALLASRVMVKPHQIGVVQRVLSARRPRFVLADEVGLGKTIEAGMIFSALRLSGLAARRAGGRPEPPHRPVAGGAVPQVPPALHADGRRAPRPEPQRGARRFPVGALSARGHEPRAALAVPRGGPGDRRRGLGPGRRRRGPPPPRARGRSPPSRRSPPRTWGLLLLTATPMQLDPDEYRALLTLLDPVTAPDAAAFRARVERQEALSRTVRALLEGNDAEAIAAVGALHARFPDDAELGKLTGREALLAHLAETYSLSEALVRNRRARVGGFSARRLHRHVGRASRGRAPRARRGARRRALRLHPRCARSPGSSGGSIPPPPRSSRRRAECCALRPPALPARDAKYQALRALLAAIWEDEPDAKVLLFTEARDTLESLRTLLSARRASRRSATTATSPLVERDRQVARFRDPEGPKLLALHRGRRRGPQLPVRAPPRELRPAVEPGHDGAAHRPARPHRPDPAGGHPRVRRPRARSRPTCSRCSPTRWASSARRWAAWTRCWRRSRTAAHRARRCRPRRGAHGATPPSWVAEAPARAQVRRAYDPLLDVRSFDRDGGAGAGRPRPGAASGSRPTTTRTRAGGRALGHRPRPGRAAGGDGHRAGAPRGHRRGHRRAGGRLPVRLPLRPRAEGRGAAGAGAGRGAHGARAPSGATRPWSRRRSTTSPPGTPSSRRCSASSATGPYGRNGCRAIQHRGRGGPRAGGALPRRAPGAGGHLSGSPRPLAPALARAGPRPDPRGGDRPTRTGRPVSSRGCSTCSPARRGARSRAIRSAPRSRTWRASSIRPSPRRPGRRPAS